jgi:hypothetical protein
MEPREQRLLLGAAFATSVLLLLSALAGHAELVAYAAPLLVLVLPLVAGRYVGEEALERLRERAAGRPRAALAAAAAGGARRGLVAFPRGGRLIAHALAERGPPAGAPA